MPGINFISSKTNISLDDFSSINEQLCYRSDVTTTELIRLSETALSFTAYKGYPYLWEDTDEAIYICEGLIYNKSNPIILQEIAGIIKAQIENKDYKMLIKQFIDSSDGDYLICIYLKGSKDSIIFNDRWARLPTYCTIENETITVSRDYKFMLDTIAEIKFDRLAISEFLMFGYHLGEKTMVCSIEKLKASSLIVKSNKNSESTITYETLFTTDFSFKDQKLSKHGCIDKCVELYKTSISNRVEKCKEVGLNIVTDISGGFDTRAVYVGLCQTDTDFMCCTDRLVTGDESGIGQQLTSLYSRDLQIFEPDRSTNDLQTMQELTYLTDGNVNSWITYHCYQDALERDPTMPKPFARYMGFGGEFIRHPFRAKHPYKNLTQMLVQNAYTSYVEFKDVCKILRLENKQMMQNIDNEVKKFPETNLNDQIKHLYYDYYNKNVNSGENRHRMFAWTVEPLWGKDLFAFEMKNIPSKLISYGFFIEFLRKLDAKSLTIPIYGSKVNYASPVSLKLFDLKMLIRNAMRDNRLIINLKKYLFSIREKFRGKTALKKNLLNELQCVCQRNQTVSRTINPEAVAKFSTKLPPETVIYQLATVVLYIEAIDKRYHHKIINRRPTKD